MPAAAPGARRADAGRLGAAGRARGRGTAAKEAWAVRADQTSRRSSNGPIIQAALAGGRGAHSPAFHAEGTVVASRGRHGAARQGFRATEVAVTICLVSTATGLRGGAGGGVRRLGWGLADQGLSSMTNFALAILVARSVSTSALGAFGLAFTTYTITLGATRALCHEPLI